MKTNAQPWLEPGEQVQAIFGAQTRNQWFFLVTGLILAFMNYYVVVVVTDRRIVVGRSGRLTSTKFEEVLETLPRQTRIGPASGLWWKCRTLGPQQYYVHNRFHYDIALADSLLAPSH